jgi:tetratricopeptide (TPR) repeat protein
MDDLNPPPCPMWEETLAALHPDDLSPLAYKALKEHIVSCPTCEAALADYYRMRSLMRSVFAPIRPPGIWKTFLSIAPEQLATRPSSSRLFVLHTHLYHNLPEPDYTRFVGRQGELDWLCHRLSRGYSVDPMIVSGIGGVGKSALALAVAHHYREHFEDLPLEERFNAIIWISAQEERLPTRKNAALPGLAFPTLGDIYTTIAKTLAREDITRATEKQDLLVRKALSTHRTLLILDNINSVLDQEIKVFLKNLPLYTKCLITSRESAHAPQARTLMGLHLEEAEKMVMEEAQVHHIRLGKAQRQRLSSYTEGLPLPIKLSIARLKNGETFEQVVHWLSNASDNLPDYCVKEQIHLVHLQSASAWKLLLGCSLFDQNSGASRDALGAIADLSLVDRDNGLALLQRLALLNQDMEGRFWLLPFIHGHVVATLLAHDSGLVMIERWLNWLTAFIETRGSYLEFHVEYTQVVSSEYPHLLNAIRWCYEHERWATLLQLAKGANFYPYLVGLFHELQECLEAGIQASVALQNERYRGQFLRLLGRMFWAQGQYTKAQNCLDQAEEIAVRYQDEMELGRSANIRFGVLFEQKHFSAAEQVAYRMWERAEQMDDLELKILAVYRLAECESHNQQFNRALQWLDQSEQWCIELGWSRRLAWNLSLRGATLILQGKVVEAEPLLTQSLAMATSWNEYNLIALTKQYLAQVYISGEQFHQARKYAIEAYDLYERLGMLRKMATVEQILHALEKRSM